MKTTAIIVSMILAIVILSGCVDNTAPVSNTSCAENQSCGNESNVPPAGTELETHGDFETQESKECWKFYPGDPSSEPQASAIAYEGSRAMAITNTETNESYWTYKQECLVPVVDGKTYELTTWIKADKADIGDIGGVNVVLEFLDDQEANKPIKTKLSTSVKIAKEGVWTQVSAKELAPAGSKFAQVKLVISGTGTATFDAVKITEQ